MIPYSLYVHIYGSLFQQTMVNYIWKGNIIEKNRKVVKLEDMWRNMFT